MKNIILLFLAIGIPLWGQADQQAFIDLKAALEKEEAVGRPSDLSEHLHYGINKVRIVEGVNAEAIAALVTAEAERYRKESLAEYPDGLADMSWEEVAFQADFDVQTRMGANQRIVAHVNGLLSEPYKEITGRLGDYLTSYFLRYFDHSAEEIGGELIIIWSYDFNLAIIIEAGISYYS